jgi:hypothetical protein
VKTVSPSSSSLVFNWASSLVWSLPLYFDDSYN